MFSFYKRHNNKLYNNLAKLSQNKFFYQDIGLEDKIENRILLVFFHFALILHHSKGKKEEKERQIMFDNIFQNIEYTFREMGHGDVTVNKEMKSLTRVFYDILVTIEKRKKTIKDNDNFLIKKYFNAQKNNKSININKLSDYFDKFENFCFDLDVKNMLNGSFNYIYK